MFEAGRPDPGCQAPPCIGLTAVRTSRCVVGGQPVVEDGIWWVVRHRPVVRIPDGHIAAGGQHSPDLNERVDRFGEMLKDLVGIHDIERVVGKRQLVHGGLLEPDIPDRLVRSQTLRCI